MFFPAMIFICFGELLRGKQYNSGVGYRLRKMKERAKTHSLYTRAWIQGNAESPLFLSGGSSGDSYKELGFENNMHMNGLITMTIFTQGYFCAIQSLLFLQSCRARQNIKLMVLS